MNPIWSKILCGKNKIVFFVISSSSILKFLKSHDKMSFSAYHINSSTGILLSNLEVILFSLNCYTNLKDQIWPILKVFEIQRKNSPALLMNPHYNEVTQLSTYVDSLSFEVASFTFSGAWSKWCIKVAVRRNEKLLILKTTLQCFYSIKFSEFPSFHQKYMYTSWTAPI